MPDLTLPDPIRFPNGSSLSKVSLLPGVAVELFRVGNARFVLLEKEGAVFVTCERQLPDALGILSWHAVDIEDAIEEYGLQMILGASEFRDHTDTGEPAPGGSHSAPTWEGSWRPHAWAMGDPRQSAGEAAEEARLQGLADAADLRVVPPDETYDETDADGQLRTVDAAAARVGHQRPRENA